MQQMSNILLSNSSKSADVGAKGPMQDVENTSFLSTFNQASESSAERKNANVKAVDSNVEAPIYDADIENELNKTAEQLSDENSDAEMIFAQLTMADNLGKRHPRDGNELPHVDKNAVYIEKSATLEPIVNSPSTVGDKLDDLTFEQIDLESLDSKSSEFNVDELFTETIHVSPASSTSQAISELNSEQLANLMTFNKLSSTELQALDAQALNELISDYNLQVPVVNESILAMAELELNINDDASVNVLNSQQQSEIDKVLTANTTGVVAADIDAELASTPNSATLAANTASPFSAELSASKSELNMTSALAADAKSILGDKTRVDGNIQPTATDVKTLEKAEFSVVLDSVAAKRANEPNVSVNSANNGLDMFADVSEVDSKSLQNQSSFTPVHKSEVPQFQLSLRPQAEAGSQMQEMIQKFSPVMKQQLITMVSNGIQQAEIRLDPPELGHLTVKIQIQGDQTQVQFHVVQSQTRDLVEQAIPRLRDMLASEGLQLTDSQVSQGGSGREQQQESSEHQGQASDSQLDEISAQEVSLMTNTSRSLHSAIDYYA
ncbi:flagellar hook-length control protein FliK [Shewanella ulleungensis]|uniref:Flagellar hook-length control protein FliK n=1 Tax=Shewanella ulleungensis TaxID=2282699 RepID=A0ABQ2QWG2_9GAMM|nr:flagellar hook-length control protein FliK [Shewanella ulleungensis]MCL1152098.1 flagellar hook-length control protein FliK [Shewanella ulleungensis]GGP99845.1 flagellar hook-length control protein FliK [Shewanella ulleungensis]